MGTRRRRHWGAGVGWRWGGRRRHLRLWVRRRGGAARRLGHGRRRPGWRRAAHQVVGRRAPGQGWAVRTAQRRGGCGWRGRLRAGRRRRRARRRGRLRAGRRRWRRAGLLRRRRRLRRGRGHGEDGLVGLRVGQHLRRRGEGDAARWQVQPRSLQRGCKARGLVQQLAQRNRQGCASGHAVRVNGHGYIQAARGQQQHAAAAATAICKEVVVAVAAHLLHAQDVHAGGGHVQRLRQGQLQRGGRGVAEVRGGEGLEAQRGRHHARGHVDRRRARRRRRWHGGREGRGRLRRALGRRRRRHRRRSRRGRGRAGRAGQSSHHPYRDRLASYPQLVAARIAEEGARRCEGREELTRCALGGDGARGSAHVSQAHPPVRAEAADGDGQLPEVPGGERGARG